MPYPMVTKDAFRALKAKIAAKRSKRDIKRADNLQLASISRTNAPVSTKGRKQGNGSIKRLIKRGPLKKAIVRLLGLLDRKKNGPLCRLMDECPQFPKIGYHNGDTSCHIAPQSRGDAARLVQENVYWGCGPANFGEMMNRSLYREKHIRVFGKERVERVEAIANTIKQIPTPDLLVMREDLKRMVEG